MSRSLSMPLPVDARKHGLVGEGNIDQPAFTAAQHGAGRDNHLADITFAHFEVDGSGVWTQEYDALAKGIGLQYVLRGRFSDLFVHDTAATGFGCDFLQDTLVEGVLAERCGRQDPGERMGGAGTGIGVGGWSMVERLTITARTAVGNGTNGIFVELQKEHWPPPRGIRITACHVEDNRFGISDWGADGLLVTSSTMLTNHEAGFDVSSQGTSGVGGRGGIVTGCVIDGNVRDGLGIGSTPGPYAFRGNRISNNGRRAAPAASGGGDGVRFSRLSMIDENADWPPDGHRGKQLTVGAQHAVVTFNTETELRLAPVRPGSGTAWIDGTPTPGSPYRLPGSPAPRAGITTAATVCGPHMHSNRIWDDQRPRTQTHALWITHEGSWRDGRVVGNDFRDNASAATRFDTAPVNGRWHDNES
ncbi:right-handed parallel beta-helix repeat-containing protein [Streptomyces sp. HC307]|uniref:right-handed parallel beta-helix repeat-containing protein n=1 Tax=Streptomyces flavusporus TaxID=3385496 RepID=UPI0039176524